MRGNGQLCTATVDIESASRYFAYQAQNEGMDQVASTVEQAGYYLTKHDNPKMIVVVTTYLSNALPIIDHVYKQNAGALTPSAMKQLMVRLSQLTPSEFEEQWFPY